MKLRLLNISKTKFSQDNLNTLVEKLYESPKMISDLHLVSIENFEQDSQLLGNTLLRPESELRTFACYPSILRIGAQMPEIKLLAGNRNLMNLQLGNFYLKFPQKDRYEGLSQSNLRILTLSGCQIDDI